MEVSKTPSSPGRIRFWIALLVGIGIFLGLMVAWLREPSYQGKILTEWVEQYRTNVWAGSKSSNATHEASVAIRHLGPDVIPYLLEMITTDESPTLKRLRKIVPRKWHDPRKSEWKAGELRRLGAYGLLALGTNAEPAIPTLIALSSHPNEDVRYITVFAMRNSKAETAIPFLIQCLTNSDFAIREEAARCLGNVARRSEVAVPALTQYALKYSGPQDTIELRTALYSLAQFGPAAKPALPILIPCLQHSDPELSNYARIFLPLIDPDVVAKAGASNQSR